MHTFMDSVKMRVFGQLFYCSNFRDILSTWRMYVANDICNIHNKSLVLHTGTETEILFSSQSRLSAMVIADVVYIEKTTIGNKYENITLLNYQIAH